MTLATQAPKKLMFVLVTLAASLGACSASPGKSDALGPSATGGSTTGGTSAAAGGSGGDNFPSAGGSLSGDGGSLSANGGSSGSANSGGGGSGGTEGSPGKTVLPCSELDSSPTGEWEPITIAPVAKNIASLILDPSRPGTVYVGAGAAMNSYGGPGVGTWKTTDCGATWNRIEFGENADKLNSGVQTTWAIDPSHPDTLYGNSLYGSLGLYRSDNAGVDWVDITPQNPEAPAFVQMLSMDPTNPSHLALTFHDNCTGAVAPQCLGESFDRGDTWTLVKGPGGGWEENGGPVLLGEDVFLYSAPADALYLRDSSDGSWEAVGPGSNPATQGVLMGTDPKTWTMLENSPHSTAVVSDGKHLYASHQNLGAPQPFFSAPIDDPTNWTNMVTANISQGAINMGYDPDHHVIYSSNNLAGMWRMRLE
jgi:hypothetical protein